MESQNTKPLTIEEFIPEFNYKDIRTPNLGYTVAVNSTIDHSKIIEFLRRG